MTDNHRMEALSRAYAQAVAAVCGCTCARPEPDYGVDLWLRQVEFRHKRWQETGPNLYVQLKSTSGAIVTPTEVGYDLKADDYNLLRRTTRKAPSLLVLLVLPADKTAWVDHTEERLEIRRCVYWLSLRGLPASKNTSSIRVHIPRANQFTPAALTRIMKAIQRKENP